MQSTSLWQQPRVVGVGFPEIYAADVELDPYPSKTALLPAYLHKNGILVSSTCIVQGCYTLTLQHDVLQSITKTSPASWGQTP